MLTVLVTVTLPLIFPPSQLQLYFTVTSRIFSFAVI